MDSSQCPYCNRRFGDSGALVKHQRLKVECKIRHELRLKRLLEDQSSTGHAKRLKTSTRGAIDRENQPLAISPSAEEPQDFIDAPVESALSPVDHSSISVEGLPESAVEMEASMSGENIPFETDIDSIAPWMEEEDDDDDPSLEAPAWMGEEENEDVEGTNPSTSDPSSIPDEDYDPNYLVCPSVLMDNADSVVTDTYPGAASILEKQRPHFAQLLEEQKKRGTGNIYHPFNSAEDWSLGQWMYLSGVSQSNVDTFLHTDYVSKLLSPLGAWLTV
jgi:hypothetical protein